jgi:hypothetical protein
VAEEPESEVEEQAVLRAALHQSQPLKAAALELEPEVPV